MSIRFFASFFLVFLFVPAYAYANVVISEIMYDALGSDSDREWIEIYNTSADAEDISGWKFFENGAHHKITPLTSAVIPASGYAVIADNPTAFRADWPTYTGLLFDSSFSLKNTGESLVLKNASSTIITETFYETQFGKGDGNSLNRVGAGFEARIPSPGAPVNPTAFIPKINESKGNPAGVGAVQKGDSAEKIRAVSNTASAGSFQEGAYSGMIPWALALLGVILFGSVALLFQGKSHGSGYSIIEEKQ